MFEITLSLTGGTTASVSFVNAIDAAQALETLASGKSLLCHNAQHTLLIMPGHVVCVKVTPALVNPAE